MEWDYGPLYPDETLWINNPNDPKGPQMMNPNYGEEFEKRANFPEHFPDYKPGSVACEPYDYICKGYNAPWEDPKFPANYKKIYIERNGTVDDPVPGGGVPWGTPMYEIGNPQYY